MGNLPDSRMQQTAQKHGINLNSRARQFQAADFEEMDLVLAMDQSNLNSLQKMRPESELKHKLFLFRSFDPENDDNLEVPDPYYGGDNGFEMVYQIVERTCPKVLEYLKRELTKKT